MTITLIHTRNNPVRLYGILLLGMLLCGLFSLQAQEAEMNSLEFFELRAHQDAAYEHHLQWNHREDEVDYWKDQQRFEEKLRKKYFLAYRTYREHKKKAYLIHEQECDKSCAHGDYYLMYASYYTQYQVKEQAMPGATVVMDYNPQIFHPE